MGIECTRWKWRRCASADHSIDSEHCLAQEDSKIHFDAADPSLYLTKATTRDLTEQFAHSFRHKYGIGENGPNTDVVIGFCSVQMLAAPAFYATIAAGGVWSAASHSYTVSELARQIDQGPAKLVICTLDTQEVAVKAAKKCGLALSRVVVLGRDPWSFKSADGGIDLVTKNRLTWERITNKERLENSLIVLLYSSGTTGIPKG